MYFPNPSTTRRMWRRGSFSAEFSFYETSCLIKSKECSLLYYLPVAEGEKKYIQAFLKGIMQCICINNLLASYLNNDKLYYSGNTAFVLSLIIDSNFLIWNWTNI